MAFTAITPATCNISMTQGNAQSFLSSAVNAQPSGSPQDLSAWTGLVCKMVPPTPVPYGSDSTFGTVTGNSSGILTVQVSATDLASVPPGTAKLIISGKPTSPDALQLLATGSLTVSAG